MKLNSVVIQTVFKVVNYQYIQPKLQLKFKFRLKGFLVCREIAINRMI